MLSPINQTRFQALLTPNLCPENLDHCMFAVRYWAPLATCFYILMEPTVAALKLRREVIMDSYYSCTLGSLVVEALFMSLKMKVLLQQCLHSTKPWCTCKASYFNSGFPVLANEIICERCKIYQVQKLARVHQEWQRKNNSKRKRWHMRTLRAVYLTDRRRFYTTQLKHVSPCIIAPDPASSAKNSLQQRITDTYSRRALVIPKKPLNKSSVKHL